MEMFELNQNTRVIGIQADRKLLSNDPEATIDTISKKGVIVNKEGKIISPILPIGILTKGGYWKRYKEVEYNKIYDLIKASLFGFAVGDAFGVPTEFLDREEIRKLNLQEMQEYGSHNVPKGSWSDDTSMIIATMEAIKQCNGEIDYDSIMTNFIKWYSNARFTSLDKTFGVGKTVFQALQNYSKGTPPLECGGNDYMDNDNGSLMRILPISLYCIVNNFNDEETMLTINNLSALTHAHDISKLSCYIYTIFLKNIINRKDPKDAFLETINMDFSKYYSQRSINAHKKILSKDFLNIKDNEINQSGYVVDSLESALYSIINTKNYEDAIKTAVSLGYDTDTVAGITGSIAGIIYGYENIPKNWLNDLKKRDYLEEIAKRFNSVILKKVNDQSYNQVYE
ncbi:MAG: ADP-ribosylglycohydrolase family protein [Bacilli bacterium]|nr:ADP-ribosylglycohydrolase family protein [Bacilli bacterium]